MKKTVFILSLVTLLAAISCQRTPEPLTVDYEVEEAAINDVFDMLNKAFIAGDVNTLASLLSEDLMGLGSDLNEVFNKKTVTDLWTQMFAAGPIAYEPFGNRMIKLAPDGKSATVIEQYMMPAFSEILPFRNSYHIIKIEDDWKILLFNTAITPKNEHIPIINAALASE